MKRIIITLPNEIDPADKGIEQSIEAFVTEIDPEEKGAFWEVLDMASKIKRDWRCAACRTWYGEHENPDATGACPETAGRCHT